MDDLTNGALAYFRELAAGSRLLKAFFAARSKPQIEAAVRAARRESGGSVLFRPVGLKIFAEVARHLRQRNGGEWKESVRELRALPEDLNKRPYRNTIWDGRNMILKNAVLARQALLFSLGALNKKEAAKVVEDYGEVTGERLANQVPFR